MNPFISTTTTDDYILARVARDVGRKQLAAAAGLPQGAAVEWAEAAREDLSPARGRRTINAAARWCCGSEDARSQARP